MGESGCGKTTTLVQMLDLVQPTAGSMVVLGRDVATLGDAGERKAMRRDLSVVFQDPMAALDPRLPVFDVIAEPLRAHGVDQADGGQAGQRAAPARRPGAGPRQPLPAGTSRAASASASSSPGRWRSSPS